MSVNQFISAAILRALGLDAWPTRGVSEEADLAGGGGYPAHIMSTDGERGNRIV